MQLYLHHQNGGRGEIEWIRSLRKLINIIYSINLSVHQKQFFLTFFPTSLSLPPFFWSSTLGKGSRGLQPEEKSGLQGQGGSRRGAQQLRGSSRHFEKEHRCKPELLSEASLGHEPTHLPSAMEYDQSGETPTTGPLAEQGREGRKTLCMNKSSLLRALRGKGEETRFPLTRRISKSEGGNAGEFRDKKVKR